jgi:di/tricarboxylate transporter
VLLILDNEPYYRTPGFVMTGLGLVCFSILSKVGLLALVWRRTFALADRVPLIPVVTALSCLFLAAFVSQAAVTDTNVFIAARVLVGLGAICFTLYSIVSILESGTSKSK